MAIVSVKEIHDGRGGDDSIKSNKSVRKHDRVFRVIADSPYDGSFEVLLALPRLGSLHPRDLRAFCTGRNVNNESKSKLVWIGKLIYSTEREQNENPLAVPAAIEWDTDTSTEPFYFDADDKPILNAAGDYFEDTVKDEVSLWTVEITKNLPFVPAWLNGYRNAVNSDFILIDGLPIDVGMAKIKKIHISKWQQTNDIWFRELHLTIKIQDSWVKKILHQGLRCLVGNPLSPGDFLLMRCQDSNGKDATKPMLLNEDGTQMYLPIDPTTIVPLEVDLRKMKPFCVLPLN
jgi:hypothetical protein